ncbi:MAG TPA: hypothetical protein VLC09_10335 [Polyangiaceae bacterium]|nr:hypothetical protein [Polyangiaceae bacterium]
MAVTLLTDSTDDKSALLEALASIPNPAGHPVHIYDDGECRARAVEQFRGHPNVLAFQGGHPCWRKITDPLLFTAPGEEAIILDPDLYFPNHFTFEPTPEQGVLLMWQKPNCLVPPETTWAAFDAPARLAHHVDIGVGHMRTPLDLDWLDWFLGKLGGKALPRSMHVEAITWSALAMRMGGGHLDPTRWLCWHRSQWKRVQLLLGRKGAKLLRGEALAEAKCFHAGGAAKWWLDEAHRNGWLDFERRLDQASPLVPFVELRREDYTRERKLKDALRSLGYYRLIGES